MNAPISHDEHASTSNVEAKKEYADYQNLFALFNFIYPLSDELKAAIVHNSHILDIKRKVQLLTAGDVSNSIYFIINGAARVYYLDEAGNETTTWFLFENELLISVSSFFTGKPSFEYLETTENSKLIVLKRNALDKIYNDFIEFNAIGRKLTEHYYIRNEEHANVLRTLNTKDRYQHLMDTQPGVLKRASLGHIASYLGMSKETLSRIRK